ncbi:MAG TPA: lipoyl(octanoyl) transferase LipB [Saprospiraceae bacterium]|nr:lipoyl(octanoyl) transferase LipB [Saprospiraceae bacterium]
MKNDVRISIHDLGLMDYRKAWERQTELHNQLINNKLADTPNLEQHFILCEHPVVYTLGRSGSMDHLLLSQKELSQKGYTFYKINRGGDITHHGPGQIVGYPILDLSYFRQDVGWYVRSIEEVIIRTLADFDIQAVRIEKYTGVWIEGSPMRKIAAIGVHMSRWVTLHGFALNINNDIHLFDHIIPCGIQDPNKSITSLAAELGKEIAIEDVKKRIIHHFEAVFDVQTIEKAPYINTKQ